MEPDELDYAEEEDFWDSDLFDNSWYEDPDEEGYQDWLEDVWWDD